MMHLECYASNSSAVLAPDSAAFCPLHPQSQQAQEPGTESLKVRVKIVKTEGKGRLSSLIWSRAYTHYLGIVSQKQCDLLELI